MRATVIGDNELIVNKAQTVVLRCGLECGENDVLSLETAAEHAGRVRRDVIVLTLSPDPIRALEVLRGIRNITDALVVAVGPANDPKFILRVLREGAQEYVDDSELDGQLQASLVRAKVKRTEKADGGCVIGVLGGSGGCGTSTVAVNLAAALARGNQQTVVIDLRLAAGDQSILLDLRPIHTLVDLCRNLDRMDEGLFQRSLACHECGVRLLAAPISLTDTKHVSSQGVRQIVGLARTLFPFVVIDLDRAFGDESLAAIVQSDIILVVFRLDMTSLRNAQRALNQLEEMGIPAERVRVIANRYGQRRELPYRKAEQALGVNLFHFVPDDVANVNIANIRGNPVVLERPRSRVSKSLIRLASSLTVAHNDRVESKARTRFTSVNPVSPVEY